MQGAKEVPLGVCLSLRSAYGVMKKVMDRGGSWTILGYYVPYF